MKKEAWRSAPEKGAGKKPRKGDFCVGGEKKGENGKRAGGKHFREKANLKATPGCQEGAQGTQQKKIRRGFTYNQNQTN